MSWFIPTICIVFAMLACTGILCVDLKAIRRELQMRKKPLEENSEGGTDERGYGQ